MILGTNFQNEESVYSRNFRIKQPKQKLVKCKANLFINMIFWNIGLYKQINGVHYQTLSEKSVGSVPHAKTDT